MILYDFFHNVDSDPDMTWGEVFDNSVVVVNNKTHRGWNVPIKTIADNAWETLRPVIMEEREPDVLVKMTRVVGYMSQIKNWNASKLAELKARQQGNYQV